MAEVPRFWLSLDLSIVTNKSRVVVSPRIEFDPSNPGNVSLRKAPSGSVVLRLGLLLNTVLYSGGITIWREVSPTIWKPSGYCSRH